MEERDDISLISTVSSVGEEDSYLAEPTYNNLDPVWAQRHGFPDTGSSHLDIDAFSEEFDLRMRWDRGRGGGSTCSTLPRPPQGSSGPAPRPGKGFPPLGGRGPWRRSGNPSCQPWHAVRGQPRVRPGNRTALVMPRVLRGRGLSRERSRKAEGARQSQRNRTLEYHSSQSLFTE